MDFVLLSFGFACDPLPFTSFLVLFFGMEMSILCLFHCYILEAYSYLVSQVHSWRGILPQDEHKFKSHPYLI